MATSERTLPTDPTQEAARSKALAERYYHEFVDLREVRIDHDLFTTIPVDLMFRYNFVPIQATNGSLEIALADPRNLNLIDELAVLVGKKLKVRVETLSQICGQPMRTLFVRLTLIALTIASKQRRGLNWFSFLKRSPAKLRARWPSGRKRPA